jgi:hypothetical protein
MCLQQEGGSCAADAQCSIGSTAAAFGAAPVSRRGRNPYIEPKDREVDDARAD